LLLASSKRSELTQWSPATVRNAAGVLAAQPDDEQGLSRVKCDTAASVTRVKPTDVGIRWTLTLSRQPIAALGERRGIPYRSSILEPTNQRGTAGCQSSYSISSVSPRAL